MSTTPSPLAGEIPIGAAREHLHRRYRDAMRSVKMLIVLSAIIGALSIAATVWIVDDGSGPIMIAVGPLILSIVGVLLGPQRLVQLKRELKEREASLSALEASGAATVPIATLEPTNPAKQGQQRGR